MASGAATGLDGWAAVHAMPLAGAGSPPTMLETIVPLLHDSFDPLGLAVAQIVTLPGQVVVSFLLVVVAARRLWTRHRPDAAAGWIAAWLVAVAVEVVFRHALTRPIDGYGIYLVGFRASWPSGHALRCALVAAALAAAWPRLRLVLAIWLGAALVLLELAGFHVPTDIVGGLLLAAVAVAGAVAFEESGLLRRRAALRRTRPGTGS